MYPTYIECRFGEYDDEDARIIMFGVPFFSTSQGARPLVRSTSLLRILSDHVEDKSSAYDIFYSDIKCQDIGDITTIEYADISVDIESIVNRAFKDGKKVLMMGGEHTYTYFMVKAVRPSSIIILDAHLDLKESYMGAKLTHATFLRRLLDEDVVKNAYMIGARAYDEDEWIYARESDKVRIVSSIDELDEVDEPIYISIDLDVYDPSIMKTVTTPEFGGLTPEDLFTYLGKLGERNDVIAGDVMEFSPYTLDPSSLTLATKTVYEALATLYV